MLATSPKIHSGMCSVTLRQESALAVLDVAARAGLRRIEWGADVHVPPGEVRVAADVRDAGRDRGVTVASYGSYHRAGADPADDFPAVLASAVALGAPRVRIWAGDLGSAQASADQRRAVVTATRAAAEQAADVGVELAFEYHSGTLTDTAASTLRLLAEVDHPAVRTYWQPPLDLPDAAALDDLRQVLPWISAVHVFSWWPGYQRLPLTARDRLWRDVFGLLRGTGRDFDALLEFVVDDDPARVATEAAALTHLTTADRRDG
ncbi:hydroxypyruvate isomerase [Micromonospora sp. Llam0]|uniref:sugar phosphate isomerase/epimerase family protein n=1 Tax=Micromonospora sp. Llam0 TaxID=2485143 RepID=UPI000FAAEFDE|nr:TIM barrel protein [Micromonospora sp. Llam0]ROO59182.1 hydroxypyruvate isomerase [Micromonospora sp. Llam0]